MPRSTREMEDAVVPAILANSDKIILFFTIWEIQLGLVVLTILILSNLKAVSTRLLVHYFLI